MKARRSRVRVSAAVQRPAATAKARIGFLKSAHEEFLACTDKEREGLLEKLREIAFNPQLGKPLVGQLQGCVRVTYGRIRCVTRRAQGVAVVLVLVLARRSAGAQGDPYELAVQRIKSGGEDVQAALKQHITAYLKSLDSKVRRDRKRRS